MSFHVLLIIFIISFIKNVSIGGRYRIRLLDGADLFALYCNLECKTEMFYNSINHISSSSSSTHRPFSWFVSRSAFIHILVDVFALDYLVDDPLGPQSLFHFSGYH